MADVLFIAAFVVPTMIWVAVTEHINELKESRNYWRKRAIEAKHGIYR